jgi:hypothetical protein
LYKWRYITLFSALNTNGFNVCVYRVQYVSEKVDSTVHYYCVCEHSEK